jgi:hypothetical protein
MFVFTIYRLFLTMYTCNEIIMKVFRYYLWQTLEMN